MSPAVAMTSSENLGVKINLRLDSKFLGGGPFPKIISDPCEVEGGN